MPLSSVAKKKVYENGDVYEGKMKKDIPNGEGTMTYANGNVYNGYWVDGVPQGKGSFVSPSVEYTGSFVNGQYYGPGEMTIRYDDMNIVIKGFWKSNDNISDAVALLNYNGETVANYKGSLNLRGADLPVPINGEGYWPQYLPIDDKILAFYDGKWNNDSFTGTIIGGSFASQRADVKIEMSEGKIKQTTINYPDGTTYKGQSDYNQITGEGILKTSGGKTISSIWNNNKLISGKITNVLGQTGGEFSNLDIIIYPESIVLNDEQGEINSIKNNLNPTNVDEILNSLVLENKDKTIQRWENMQLQKKREEEQLEIERQEQQELLRIARAEAIKQIDSKYAGLIYQAADASFSDSGDDALAMFLFQAKSDAALRFLKGGKVELKTRMRTASDKPFENMVMSIMDGKTHVYDLYYDWETGDFWIGEKQVRLRISSDKSKVAYIFPSGKGFYLTRVRK